VSDGAEAALDAFDDGVALLDLETGALRWASAAWRRQSPGSGLADALLAALAQPDGAATRGVLALADGAAVEWARSAQPALVALRLREPAPARETRRHLEDRERLLYTSRAISVGEMAATLAHEINQPLGSVANVLRGVLARLEHRDAGDVSSTAHLQQGVRLALDQTLYAARVVGRVREFTQSRQPQYGPVDVPALLRDSLALLDWEFSRQHVQVSWSHTEPLHGRVTGDPVMLQQVFVNLLRNALDALRERPAGEGRIEVSVAHGPRGLARDEVEIGIGDNGSGLSEQAEARLFVPFQSSKPTGMGIGLNICRSFVELHQGRLWFTRNPPPQGGCTFRVALPLGDAAAATTETGRTIPGNAGATAGSQAA